MNPKQGWSLLKQTFDAWSDDYAPSMGAALAYYTLFSIAPLLLVVIGVAGLAFGEEAVRGELFGQLSGMMGDEGARAVESLLANASKPSAGIIAMVTGFAVALLGASTVFGELQNDLDRIWRAPEREQSSGLWNLIRTRLLSFGMILGVAFLLMISLVVSAALAALGTWWGTHMLDVALSFALMTLLFAMIYKIIPRVRIDWRDVWIGAAVTSALFAIGKLAIGFYIGKTSVGSPFGAAASLVVLMVWVYYSAQIFLFGAEFTRVYAHERGSRSGYETPSTDIPRIRVQAAANAATLSPPTPAAVIVKLGAALAVGIGASLGLNYWRRR